ncbi:MAG: hypothetical protein QM679_12450 [Patulibacter sp.]
MRIAQPARKHGVPDEDILHAVRHRIAQWREDEDFTMLTGPARDGALLEIGLLGIHGDGPVVIHSMPARPNYLPTRKT